ncbi:hypothetical protein, partial [Chryseobacterium jejuense]|uniref:hypothetical protein n=1 Tax=Chryseobacterium jejuense TaxID=445960 RepID=UPI001E5A29C6
PMVLLTRESRPPPVFILFLKILYHYDKGFFFALYPTNKAELIHSSRIFNPQLNPTQTKTMLIATYL